MSAFSCNRSFSQAEFCLSAALPLEVTLWRSRTTMPARHFEYTLLMAFVALASVALFIGAGRSDIRRSWVVYQGGKPTTGGWPVVWMDSSGKTQPLLAKPEIYNTPRLSIEPVGLYRKGQPA